MFIINLLFIIYYLFSFHGPFDAIRKAFATGAEYSMMSFNDKSDLFFADYGIMPLFVFENYPQINVGTKE